MRKVLLLLFSHRLLAIARWDIHFLQIRIWNALTLQTRRIRDFIAHRERPLFLNLGSGPRGLDHPQWLNVDGFRDQNVHYLLDLSRPLPLPGAAFDGVFCEHVLEHFSLAEGEGLAREVHRILRAGGCFRVVVPDAELVMRRYFEAPEEMVSRRCGGGATAIEAVNVYFRQRYEHQFLYDWSTMQEMLRRAGFGAVVRAAFGQGRHCPAAVLDDEKYEWESLYVEAVKSGPGSE